jgi:O-succinylbenzoate synthase
MQIESIVVHEVKLDLKHFFETSFARVTYEHFLLLEVTVDGVTGWSECVAGEAPAYSYETVKTALHAIEDFIAPRVFAARDYEHPDDVLPSLAPIRGHNMAKAAVEMGVWEAFARARGESLAKALGGTRTEIASGVSIGIQDSVDQLLDKIGQELSDGYRRIKMKIKPGWDVDVVRRVRERFPETPLMVDANSAYSLDDVALFQKMDELDLMMIEQPLHYEDMWDHAALQKQIRTPICLDESIHSVEDARRAIEMKATRIINIKAGRVGGLSSARAIQKLAEDHGIPVWCGGMLESGIGRAHNVHLSTLSNFSLPGDVADSKRYFVEELIAPPVEVRPDGTIRVPTGPGIGYDVQRDRIEKHRLSKKVLTP